MIETDIDYPDNFPWPNIDGYSINHVSPFVRTDISDGRARQRRMFTSVPSIVTVTWIFHGDNVAAQFEAWFRDALNDGVEWFNCPLKTPVGEKNYVCRFTEMYRGPNIAGMCAWEFSAELEIWERPIMPEGWGKYPEYIKNASLFDIICNKVWPEDK